MKKFLLAGLCLLFLACENAHPSTKKLDTAVIPDTHGDLAGVAKSLKKTDSVAESNWVYSDYQDKMTSKKNYNATAAAVESLNLSFPYGGLNYPSIILQSRRGESTVLLAVDKGQILDRSVKIRFDDGKMYTFEGSSSSDGDSKYLFIEPAATIIAKLKKAKHVVIEAEFYDNGIQQMEFNVAGLQWAH